MKGRKSCFDCMESSFCPYATNCRPVSGDSDKIINCTHAAIRVIDRRRKTIPTPSGKRKLLVNKNSVHMYVFKI